MQKWWCRALASQERGFSEFRDQTLSQCLYTSAYCSLVHWFHMMIKIAEIWFWKLQAFLIPQNSYDTKIHTPMWRDWSPPYDDMLCSRCHSSPTNRTILKLFLSSSRMKWTGLIASQLWLQCWYLSLPAMLVALSVGSSRFRIESATTYWFHNRRQIRSL